MLKVLHTKGVGGLRAEKEGKEKKSKNKNHQMLKKKKKKKKNPNQTKNKKQPTEILRHRCFIVDGCPSFHRAKNLDAVALIRKSFLSKVFPI